MEQKWKTGQVVMLISGGPRMTVRGYNQKKYSLDDFMVDCDWFISGKLELATFHQDQLTIWVDYNPIPGMSRRSNSF